jgi:hypothetical protein
MKVIDLGGGATALEPTEASEFPASFGPDRLRRLGWSDETVSYFQQFSDGAAIFRKLGGEGG